MAINTLADWTANGSLSRQSILGRPRRKDGRELPEDSEDEVLRSRTTDQHIQTFFDALEAGDESEQSYALNKVVQSWRADNNAGGLPVYAHLPLPSQFARTLAQIVRNGPVGVSSAEGVAAKLEPGARLSLLQQLSGVMNNVLDKAKPRNEAPRLGVGTSVGSKLHQHDLDDDFDDVANDLLERGGKAVGPAPVPRSLNQPKGKGPESRVAEEVRFQKLEFDPEEAVEREEVVFVDEFGRPVPSANPLSNGAIPPPRPHHNKMLPIDSAVPTKGRPQGYSSGEYDPNAIGLRVGKDKHGRLYWKRHDGIDFYARYGEPAKVAADGVVVAVAHGVRGYGSLVAVRHPDGTMTMYAHLDPRSVRVRPGQFLRLGDVLGGAGTSGNAGRPQVHFEVWRQPYLLPGGGLDYGQGHRNLLDPYEWYDRPMPGAVPRTKPAYP